MELDQDKMRQMLEFWKTQQQENPELSLLEFMKKEECVRPQVCGNGNPGRTH